MTFLVLTADAGEGAISTLRLADGGLERLASSPVGRGVGTFTIDDARELVFAGHKGADGAGPAVMTLRLDRSTGELQPISGRPVDASMTYLTLTDDHRWLLGASYGGGVGLVWPVGEDGTLGDPTARVEFANLHCVVADGDRVFFVSLGEDLIAQYTLVGGELRPMFTPIVQLPRGCGARHLTLAGDSAYLVTEYSGEVFRLDRGDDGGLSLADDAPVSIVDPAAGLAQSRFGADPRAEHLIWGADVHVGDGLLVASERSASTLATVRLGADGSFGEIASFSPTVAQPRGFGIAPDGRSVVVVGERANVADRGRRLADPARRGAHRGGGELGAVHRRVTRPAGSAWTSREGSHRDDGSVSAPRPRDDSVHARWTCENARCRARGDGPVAQPVRAADS